MTDMSLSEELTWRDFIKDRTFDDVRWLDTPRAFYFGTDCSADSLHIGNLAGYMMARHFVERGWKAVLLVGGATSLIGDPGGKEEERQLKAREEIEHNVAGVTQQVQRIFAGNEFELVNNYDWFKDIGYLEFLRDVGKHYSMTELVQRDFIAARMGQGAAGISYAEFSYSLIQGYDYWWLFKNKGVQLQIGGSDQWGNMLSGAPLIRKKEGKEVHALSMPLVIDNSTGRKFGKSEKGAVWLDAAKTPPNEFYQFWMNVDDGAVIDYLKIYTTFRQEEIGQIKNDFDSDRSSRIAQKKLAYEVTKLIHGEDAAQSARTYAESLKSGAADAESTLEARPGDSVIDLLVQGGLASSKREARQFLAGNAVYMNDQQTTKEQLEANDFINGRLKLRRGKTLQNTVIIRQHE